MTSSDKAQIGMLSKAPLFLEAIKFHESVFALPFAYMGMLLADDGFPGWRVFGLITLAMVSARTVGMASNQIVDRHIDARSPRSSTRHLPSRRLNVGEMGALTIVSLGVLVVTAALLNKLALALTPVAAAYIMLYPYAKRFTWTANLMLGWALAIAPSAAWIAVRGNISLEPVLLSLAVALWAGAFDILYHTQDREFHLREGLNSVAARFGIVVAFRISQSLDLLAFVSLVALGLWMRLDWPYYIGCVAAGGMMGYRYYLVSPTDLSNLGRAFMRINGYISTMLLAGTIAAIYL
ncbi:putative 4-hydroxybenzoate polyprenyltransferase [Dehalococcoidia bacterium]|nr:putative 4-hydroxybenzoate polyprenyltransferase [Dehalococcoidia bacterium]